MTYKLKNYLTGICNSPHSKHYLQEIKVTFPIVSQVTRGNVWHLKCNLKHVLGQRIKKWPWNTCICFQFSAKSFSFICHRLFLSKHVYDYFNQNSWQYIFLQNLTYKSTKEVKVHLLFITSYFSTFLFQSNNSYSCNGHCYPRVIVDTWI